VLEDGFATRAGDIDIIYVLRLRLPATPRRADVLRRTVGLANVLTRVTNIARGFGDYWEAAPLLERLVAEGRGFTGSRGRYSTVARNVEPNADRSAHAFALRHGIYRDSAFRVADGVRRDVVARRRAPSVRSARA
jgi:hypothetical protein